MTESTYPDLLRRWLAPPLIAFVLISVGFALGRQTAPRPEPTTPGPTATAAPRVVVTYLHGNLRCVTCNTIEGMLRAVVEERYAEALRDRRLVFREVNFDTDEALAKRYEVTASTAVVSWEHDGEERGFTKLDGVWHYKDDPEEFAAYIAEHIDAHLSPPEGSGTAP